MRTAAVITLVVSVAASACGGSPTTPSSTGSGTFTLRLKDSPFSEAKAVLVTFSEVTAHRSEGSWSTVPFAAPATSRTCDLKKLEAAEDVLGTGALPAGHYTMIRLVVSSATIYFDNPSAGTACAASISPPDGLSAAVEIPSGEVKLNRGFDLAADAPVTMLLDFDGDRSIRETGNGRYIMTPVIGIVSVQ
jgi:hypothetical protein